MFGSRSAGDFAENFTTVVTEIFREVLAMPNVRVYVDNFDNVVPPKSPGVPDWQRAGMELQGILEYLQEKDWTAQLVDWHSPTRASEQIVKVYADAATPKKLGTSYDSQVWGKAAYCSYTIAGEQHQELMMQMHQIPSIEAAKRNLALSSALLKLVQVIITFAKKSKAKTICIVGDCKVALDWIDSCVPIDRHARILVAVLCEAQLELQFTLKTLWMSNKENKIKIADRLSKGDDVLFQEMSSVGYVQVQYEQIRWWQDGFKSF